jgi:methyl-accepting chemotaxis protein
MLNESHQQLLKNVFEQLAMISRGEKGSPMDETGCDDPALNELCKSVNQLITTFNEMREFIGALAEGKLEVHAPPRNLLATPFKQLQANLLHLTWQTKQIASGDYSQRVDFMGVFSAAFNSMVEALEEKRRTEMLLKETQAKVKHLEGIIPICMYCKKIRDDGKSWQQLEQYISEHSDAMFSHGICPDCLSKAKADMEREKNKE